MENEEKQQPTNLELIEKLKGSEELQTLINNSNKAYWESNIGKEVKNIHSPYDNVVKETLGLEKPENIKSSEWIKQNLSEAAEMKKELEALKAKGDGNKAQEDLYKAKFAKLQNELKNKDNEIANLYQKGLEQKVASKIDSVLANKNFNPVYAKEELNDLLSLRKGRMIQNSKVLDSGVVVYYKDAAKTEPYLDAIGNPMTSDAVSDLVFGSLYHTKKEGGNAPSDQPQATTEGNVVAVDMNKVKSKQDFYQLFSKLMAPKGLASHEQKYLEIQRATMEHYKINTLPMS